MTARRTFEALAGALVVVVLLRADGLMRAMWLDADLDAAVVLGQVANRYTDAQIALGRLGWFEGLWIVQLLRPLPGTTVLTSLLPLGLTLGITGLVALSAGRWFGRAAGVVVLLVALPVSTTVWVHHTSWSARSPTWWAMGAAAAVVAAAAGGGRSRRVVLAAAVLVTAHAGLVLAGDRMALIVVIAPLLAAAAVCALAGRRFPGLVAAGMAAGAAGLAPLVRSAADSAGYLQARYGVTFADRAEIGGYAKDTVLAVERLWGAPEFAEVGVLNHVAATAGTIATAAALVSAAALVVRVPALWRRRRGLSDATVARTAWVVYWLVAAAGLVVAFLLTDQAHMAEPVVRYLMGLPLAVGALAAAAVALHRRAGVAIAALAAVLALSGGAALATRTPGAGDPLAESVSSAAVREAARRAGVTRGFASYWTAYRLVLETGFELDVTPAGECFGGARVCAMYLHYVDRAYEPRPGPSFLIVDRSPFARQGFPAAWVTDHPRNLPPPTGEFPVGPRATMYVYASDIAVHLRPSVRLGDPRTGRGGPLPPVP